MPTLAELDAITQADLIAGGATRWFRGGDVIGAFVAEMDYGIAEPITARLHREVDRGAFGYPPARLVTELQQATAGFLRRRTGWEVASENIHEMPDVIAILEAVLEHFLAPDAKVIVPTPAYMPFLEMPALHGREVIEVPMLREEDGRYRYDLEAIEAAFEAGGGLLAHTNPHNPTGSVMTRSELEALAEVVDRQGGRVFSDEIWHAARPGRTAHPLRLAERLRRPPHAHRGRRLQGVQPAGPEVRAADHQQRPRPRALRRRRSLRPPRRIQPGPGRHLRRLRRGWGVARGHPHLPAPQPRHRHRPGRRSCCPGHG